MAPRGVRTAAAPPVPHCPVPGTGAAACPAPVGTACVSISGEGGILPGSVPSPRPLDGSPSP